MFASATDGRRPGALGTIEWAAPRALREPAPAIRIALLDEAARAAPGDARIALALGEALIGLLQLERAADVLAGALALSPGSVRARLRWAQTLAMLRRFDETLAVLGVGQVAGAAADIAEARYLRGQALQGLGEAAAAEAAYRAAIDAYPAHSPAFRKLADLLDAAGRRRELRALCGRLLAAGVRHPRLLAQWGAELARGGDIAGAKAVLLQRDRVVPARLPTPPGFDSLEAFNEALADEILANPYASEGYAEDPVYRGGPEVHHLLHGRQPELILALMRALQDQVNAHVAGMGREGGLWREAGPTHASLAFWGVVQSGSHHLDWHLHPNAWLSGVYYVDVPRAVTAAGAGPGCIEFGPPPEVAGVLSDEIPILRIAPTSGMLLLAPGHHHHRSIPTGAPDKRISVAFDVVPGFVRRAGLAAAADVGERGVGMSARPGASIADDVFLKACSTLAPTDWSGDADLLAHIGPEEETAIVALAGRHGVRSLVARSLAWAEAAGWTPGAPTRRLLAYRDGRLVLQLRRRARVAEAIGALQAAGAEPIVFKGFVLAEEVFGDLSARSFGDCDVLVRPEAYQRAMEVLGALGYRRKVDGAPIAELMQTDWHGVSFAGADGVAIDLHWALGHDIPMRFNDLVWRTACAAPPGGLPGLRLSPELTLAHLAAHFAHHDFRELRPLVDFYVAACRQADQADAERTEALARTLGLGQTVRLAAMICRRHLRPRAAIERLSRGTVSLRTRASAALLGRGALLVKSQHPLAVWGDALRRRLMTDAPGAVLRWLRFWLAPSPESLAERFAKPYRWTLYPRYYLVQAYRVTTQSRRLFIDLR